MIRTKIGSVIDVPIVGVKQKGRSKTFNFIMFFKGKDKIIIAVSKNPDRREKEIKKQYGKDVRCIVRIHSFHGYEDKKIIQKLLSKYRMKQTDCYVIKDDVFLKILNNAKLSVNITSFKM